MTDVFNEKFEILRKKILWFFIEKKKLEEIASVKVEKLNKIKNKVSPQKKKKKSEKK